MSNDKRYSTSKLWDDYTRSASFPNNTPITVPIMSEHEQLTQRVNARQLDLESKINAMFKEIEVLKARNEAQDEMINYLKDIANGVI